MPEQKRWKKRPENSTWGDYGPDDQLGRMNELTPEKVKQGIAEVKEGKTFCLSHAARLSRRQRAQPAPASAADPPDAPRRQAQLAATAPSGTTRA